MAQVAWREMLVKGQNVTLGDDALAVEITWGECEVEFDPLANTFTLNGPGRIVRGEIE